jgi:flagellar biosynthesis/type III secretory pathway chaperone
MRPDAGLFASEREALSHFIVLLEREHEALIEPDADTLQGIVHEKLALIQLLDGLRGKRIADGSPAGQQALADIRNLTVAAQRLNDINSRLLASQRALCEARLQTLRNNNALATVYGADGLRFSASR